MQSRPKRLFQGQSWPGQLGNGYPSSGGGPNATRRRAIFTTIVQPDKPIARKGSLTNFCDLFPAVLCQVKLRAVTMRIYLRLNRWFVGYLKGSNIRRLNFYKRSWCGVNLRCQCVSLTPKRRLNVILRSSWKAHDPGTRAWTDRQRHGPPVSVPA